MRRNDGGGLDLFPNQGSGVLTSTLWGDGLVDNPGGRTIAPGDSVRLPLASRAARMKVAVRYFASVREALGSGETVEIGAGADIAALRDALVARGGRHAEALAAANDVAQRPQPRPLRRVGAPADGDEVGFFPPVTGG